MLYHAYLYHPIRDFGMLKTFEARGINKRISVPEFTFSADINLLTGANGSGKTTILKLLWYLISGNLERVAQEMTFEYIRIVTTDFEIRLELTEPSQEVKVDLVQKEKKLSFSYPLNQFVDEPPPLRDANHITGTSRSSVFFPTFRRIEGVFSLVAKPTPSRVMTSYAQSYIGLERSLTEIANRLSVVGHQFVFSISTSDIVSLLTSRYADVAQRTNSEQAELVKAIIGEIESQDRPSHLRTKGGHRGSDAKLLANAHVAIENIRRKATDYGERQATLLQPFTTLSKFIETVFADKGITISSGLVL